MKIAVITGSTRPGRRAPMVAQWVIDVLSRQPAMLNGGVTLRSVDLATTALPMFCEPAPPMTGRYQHEYTHDWSALIADFDAYIFITPEYNHSLPAVLKNAIDHLYAEWNDKAGGIVSYGTAGGVRAGEHLRHVLSEVKVATRSEERRGGRERSEQWEAGHTARINHRQYTGRTELRA